MQGERFKKFGWRFLLILKLLTKKRSQVSVGKIVCPMAAEKEEQVLKSLGKVNEILLTLFLTISNDTFYDFDLWIIYAHFCILKQSQILFNTLNAGIRIVLV